MLIHANTLLKDYLRVLHRKFVTATARQFWTLTIGKNIDRWGIVECEISQK